MSLIPLRVLPWLIVHGIHLLGRLLVELHVRSSDRPRVTLRDMAHLERALQDLYHAHDCIEAFAGIGPPVAGVRWVG
jgi:hypothetical protein